MHTGTAADFGERATELRSVSPRHLLISGTLAGASRSVPARHGHAVADRASGRGASHTGRAGDPSISPAPGGVALRLPGVLRPSLAPPGRADRAAVAGGGPRGRSQQSPGHSAPAPPAPGRT